MTSQRMKAANHIATVRIFDSGDCWITAIRVSGNWVKFEARKGLR
jgi:hypothetical protein